MLLVLFAACDNTGAPNIPTGPIPDYYYARGEGSEFVPTKHYPEDDLIICSKNVLDYGAKADGTTDALDAFQAALSDIAAAGGGTLYVPEGTYYLSDYITIPKSVTLCGDWISPEEAPAGTKGTVLITDYRAAKFEPSRSFIKMESSSGPRNVTIYYKNQRVDNPTRMTPAIGASTASQPSIENVTILNSYTAISFGEGKTTNASLVGLVNVYISALNQGVVLNNSVDVSRFENVHVSPKYWAENVIEPLSEKQKKALFDYTFENCTGITLYRGDATGLYDTYLELCKIGILLDSDPNGNGVTSGAITLTEIKNCDIGVMVENAHGIGTALTGFTATADRKCQAAVKTGSKYTYNTKVEDGKISGSYQNAAVVQNKATVTFTDMSFELNSSEYVFSAKGGVISCVGCSFKNGKVFTDDGGTSAGYFFGCSFAGGNEKKIGSKSKFVCDNTPVKMAEVKGYHVYKKTLPMPATKNIISITEYGAVADGKTDCTKAVQDAMDAMKQAGGGIVLIPTGKYVVRGYLTVPSGVELAGMLGVWCYNGASFGNSCLLLYAGADDPDGKAAISLESGSGLRGFLAWYP